MTITSRDSGLPLTELAVEHLMDIEIRFRETRIFRTPVTTRLIAVIDDGEYLYLTNTGRVVLTDPEAGSRYLAGETLRAEDMHARTAPLFETGATGYAWRGGTVNIGFVELSRSHISYRIYTVH